MCASWPFQISSEAVAELIASDLGDPDYLVRLRQPAKCSNTETGSAGSC